MSRYDVISHPATSHVAILREDYVAICGGDHCAAMLLNQFEYWHRGMILQRANARAVNQKLRSVGDDPTQIEELWAYRMVDDIQASILGCWGRNKVLDALKALCSGGENSLVLRRQSPRFIGDKSYQYLFNAPAVQDAVDRLLMGSYDAEEVETDLTGAVMEPGLDINFPKSEIKLREVRNQTTGDLEINHGESETKPREVPDQTALKNLRIQEEDQRESENTESLLTLEDQEIAGRAFCSGYLAAKGMPAVSVVGPAIASLASVRQTLGGPRYQAALDRFFASGDARAKGYQWIYFFKHYTRWSDPLEDTDSAA